MDTVLLVDGSNLLFQMFYGMPSKIPGPDGKDIRGTLGFLGALLKIVRQVHPTHIAVLFDGECHNARTDVDADYKANRPDFSAMAEEELPFSQLPHIYRGLDHLDIRYAETTDCETDDWMAAYAAALGPETQLVISSYDSDFFQLISDRVRILRYRGENTRICDRAWLREALGIEPEQYAAFKALTGDNSDNLRGVPKVGPKTAAALLRQFGDLESLIAGVDEIAKPSIRRAVAENLPRLRTNYQLIRLLPGAPLPFQPEELRFSYHGETTTEVLRAIGLR